MGFKNKIKKTIRYVLNCRKEKIIKPIITPVLQADLLAGKVAMVTGGSSGIGFSISKAFLDAGAKVILVGTNRHKLDTAVSRLENIGGGYVAFLLM